MTDSQGSPLEAAIAFDLFPNLFEQELLQLNLEFDIFFVAVSNGLEIII